MKVSFHPSWCTIFIAPMLCAQIALALPAFLPETDEGIFLSNALQSLSSFLDTEEGQRLFQSDFSIPEFQKKADLVTFQFVEAELRDRFGTPRCLLNKPGSSLIQVTRRNGCLDRLQNEPAELQSILFHEVLNMLHEELPSQRSGSVYPLSKKLLTVDPAAITLKQKFVLHPTCEIWSAEGGTWADNFSFEALAQDQQSYLAAKGYRYSGIWEPTFDSISPSLKGRADLDRIKPLILQIDITREDADEKDSWRRKDNRLKVSVRLVGTRYLPHNGRVARDMFDESQLTFHSLYHSMLPIRLRVINHNRELQQPTHLIRKPKPRMDDQLFHIPDCVSVPLLEGS